MGIADKNKAKTIQMYFYNVIKLRILYKNNTSFLYRVFSSYNNMFNFVIDISSLYYSYFPKIIYPFMNSSKIYQSNPIRKEEDEDSTPVIKHPVLTIITDIDDDIVNANYKLAISQRKKSFDNVQYFRSYLKYFYSCEKSEEEIERILQTIKTIRDSVRHDFDVYSSICKTNVITILKNNEYFYKKTSNSRIVKLYFTTYFGKKAVLKVYLFYPNYVFLKTVIETQFENEIIFSIYAKQINKKCDFISPEIYSYGSIPVYDADGLKMKCLFIMMEFMEGISLNHVEFTPEVCTKIYEIKQKLSCELLSHNDLYPRNMMLDSSNNLIVLDYGQSSYSQ